MRLVAGATTRGSVNRTHILLDFIAILVACLFFGLSQAGIVSHLLGWIVIGIAAVGAVLTFLWYRYLLPFQAQPSHESPGDPFEYEASTDLLSGLVDDLHPEAGASTRALPGGGYATHVRKYKADEGWDPQKTPPVTPPSGASAAAKFWRLLRYGGHVTYTIHERPSEDA
jgi:hypothetical protein